MYTDSQIERERREILLCLLYIKEWKKTEVYKGGGRGEEDEAAAATGLVRI